MDNFSLILGFLGIIGIGNVILGSIGVFYSIAKNDNEKLNFYTKVVTWSILVCAFSFGILVFNHSK